MEISSLSAYLLLLPLLATKNIELLRPENEDELLRIFERYASGGFEYLRGAISTSPDTTGQMIISNEIHITLNQMREAASDPILDILG